MRSRYSAYAVGDLDHIFRTWHPRTRPGVINPDQALTWIGLEILETVDGGPCDDTGEVEFVASFRRPDGPGERRERSRFVRRATRWVYVDAGLNAPG